ncbi:cysteine desulfurase [Natroniella sulfidigena]|uniref:cysteine desulfurase family protein n=1 Tax=Natroniella sulfidigena TaxID=723921 RepID=UPI00200A81C4|nr:cysteine desulfurase family protein [Natroniella sulfidigena]MCK8817161.1 cysteine desulfurase [Natroniella sulfidigena]
MIYLDNSATTKIDPRVIKKMLPYLKEEYGNPTSKHYTLAQNAESAVEVARSNLSTLLNCENDEIIFTSGASESNNFILKGIADYYQDQGNHIITSSVEHKSILKCCNYLEKKGYKITYLPVNKKGQIEIDTLKKAITDQTILISLLWGNNELGSLNPVKKLATVAKENDILFHTDATQILGKIDINAQDIPFDFLSCSAHKIHGPKGVGAAFIKTDDIGLRHELTPLIHGGNQEDGLRAGTLSVHNIVGLGEAARIAFNEMSDYIPKIKRLENLFKEKIKNKISNLYFNGDQTSKIPGIINMTIPIQGVNNKLIITNLEEELAISDGSACSITEPSHVLKAIGLNRNEITSTFRISLSKFNTPEEIEQAIDLLIKTINEFKI